MTSLSFRICPIRRFAMFGSPLAIGTLNIAVTIESTSPRRPLKCLPTILFRPGSRSYDEEEWSVAHSQNGVECW